jgi:hypothetical protein
LTGTPPAIDAPQIDVLLRGSRLQITAHVDAACLGCHFRRRLARIQRDDFCFYRSTIRACEVVERKVAVRWMKLDFRVH